MSKDHKPEVNMVDAIVFYLGFFFVVVGVSMIHVPTGIIVFGVGVMAMVVISKIT